MRLASGLHRLGNGLINSYLVETEGAITVVDAGVAGMYPDLERELADMGRTLADVRGIVLTHGDTDHTGFAQRLHGETGAPVFVHAADQARARGAAPKSMSGWGPMRIRPLAGFFWYGLRKGGLRGTPVQDLVPIDGERTLDLPGEPRIIAIPGHTPGSVAIHVPRMGALFVGDAMTTRSVLTGETGPRLAPFTLDPATALASLGKLEGIEAAWLLPGHGPAWTDGVPEALRVIREAASRAPLAAPRDR